MAFAISTPKVRSILTALLLLAGLLIAPASPLVGQAEATSTAWTGTGTGVTTVVSDGLTEPAKFTYDAPGVYDGQWWFHTTTPTTSVQHVAWDYEGFHDYYEVTVRFEAFVSSGGTTTFVTLVDEGPTDCCESPSNGFAYSGSHVFTVQAGDTYGFRMTGSHFTTTPEMYGTLVLDELPHNVAPVVTAAADHSSSEGDELSLELATFTDPDDFDGHAATVDWGDGSPATGTVTEPGFEGGDLAGWSVSGTVTVESAWGGFTPASGGYFALVEAGCPGSPATLTRDFYASAGDVLSGEAAFKTGDYLPYNDYAVVKILQGDVVLFYMDVATVGDYGQTPWTPWSYTFPADGVYTLQAAAENHTDCGYSSYLLLDGAHGTLSGSHVYADDGMYIVEVCVSDDDGGVGCDTLTVTVGNLPPSVEAGEDQSADEGDALSFDLATFTDAGTLDTHAATVDWGDGSPVESATVTATGMAAGVGTVYVVNQFDQVIAVDTTTGVQTVVSSGGNISNARMMTLDEAAGQLFVADNVGRVVSIDIATGSETVVSSGGALYQPWGIDLEPGGDIVVATYSSLVRVDRATGAQTVVASIPGCWAHGLAVEEDGDFLVTDSCGYSLLLRVDAGGGSTATLATDIRDATDITVDASGDIYVVERGRGGQITRIDPVTGAKSMVAAGSALVTSSSYGIAESGGVLYTTRYWPFPGLVAATDADTGTQAALTSGDYLAYPLGIAASTAGGGAGTVSGSHVYADDGMYIVEVCVSDDDGGVGCDTLTVTVANVAPSVDAGPDQSIDEGEVVSLAPATFIDAGTLDTHTATVDWGDGSTPATGTVTSADGNGTVAASHLYADDGTYVAEVCVTDDDGGVGCDTFEVTVSNVAPEMAVDPATSSVQYSDPITETRFTAVDIAADEPTVELSWSAGGPFVAGLPDLLVASAPACSVDLMANTNTCSRTISGIADLAPGIYTVRATATDDEGAFSTIDTVITVEPEDARSFYIGPLFVSTPSADNGLVEVELRATVQDISAATGDPATDDDPGDIRNATVEFRDDSDDLLCGPVPVELVIAGDTSVGTATCVWTADIGNADAVPFAIHIVVGGHYIDTSDNEVVVTVARPLDNFITGGGYLVAENSDGEYAAGDGEKLNYGFNVKFNKKQTNLQGRVTIIVRGEDGHKYKIKSNRLQSLGVILGPGGEEPHYAEFQSKANLTDVTDELNPIGLGGNLTLLMQMHDNGEPGDTDTIGFSLWDSSGALLFSSNWNGVQTVEQIVAGGNLQVR